MQIRSINQSDNLSCTSCQFVPGILLAIVVLLASAAASAQQNFADAPLCEASSALVMRCPGTTEQCLYVGDNEQSKLLFVLPLVGDTVALTKRSEVELVLQHRDPTKSGVDEVSDIEALVEGANNSLLIIASHSRNSRCEAKKKRRRIASIDLGAGTAAQGKVSTKKRLDCEQLFDDSALGDPLVATACELITNTEKAADDIESALAANTLTKKQAKQQCNALAPFNAEGAVAIPGPNGPDIWVGLRSPLLAQAPGSSPQAAESPLAMLLHMPDSTDFRFDRVVLLDMSGRGVRELAQADGWVWVIAGPAEDKADCFELMRFSVNDLVGDQVIHPESVGCLPTSSEGLALSGNRAFVVIDGDKGDLENTGVCGTPSGFMTLTLPSP